jgi:hypothetical protein
LWIDYVDSIEPFWRQVFAKPGLVLATPPGTGALTAALRAAGASTVFFDLKLAARVGTPEVPFDPSTIADNANKEFDAAVKQAGCSKPLIAENELFGGSTQTPRSPPPCVYVWTRNTRACNWLAAAGAGFDSSLTAGQLLLPPGVVCTPGSCDRVVDARGARGGDARPGAGGSDRARLGGNACRSERVLGPSSTICAADDVPTLRRSSSSHIPLFLALTG